MSESRFWSAIEHIIRSPTSSINSQQASIPTASTGLASPVPLVNDSTSRDQLTIHPWTSDEIEHTNSRNSARKAPDSLYEIASENLKSRFHLSAQNMASTSTAPASAAQPQDQSEEINKRLNVIFKESVPGAACTRIRVSEYAPVYAYPNTFPYTRIRIRSRIRVFEYAPVYAYPNTFPFSSTYSDTEGANSPVAFRTSNFNLLMTLKDEKFICFRLKGLRPSESLPNRLKSFEELIKLGELFTLNEVAILNIFS